MGFQDKKCNPNQVTKTNSKRIGKPSNICFTWQSLKMDLTFKSTFRDTKYQIHMHPSQSGNTLAGENSNFKKLFLVLLIINEFVPLPLSSTGED